MDTLCYCVPCELELNTPLSFVPAIRVCSEGVYGFKVHLRCIPSDFWHEAVSAPSVTKGVSPRASGHMLSSTENPTLLIQHPVADGIVLYDFFPSGRLDKEILRRRAKSSVPYRSFRLVGADSAWNLRYGTHGVVERCGIY